MCKDLQELAQFLIAIISIIGTISFKDYFRESYRNTLQDLFFLKDVIINLLE